MNPNATNKYLINHYLRHFKVPIDGLPHQRDRRTTNVEINTVIAIVSASHKIPVSAMRRKTRQHTIARARFNAFFLLFYYVDKSLKEIGDVFAPATYDHSTVIHGRDEWIKWAQIYKKEKEMTERQIWYLNRFREQPSEHCVECGSEVIEPAKNYGTASQVICVNCFNELIAQERADKYEKLNESK